MPIGQENHLYLFISSSYSYYSRWEMCFKTCLSSYYKTDTVLCRLKSKEEGERLFALRGEMEKHGRKRVERWNNQKYCFLEKVLMWVSGKFLAHDPSMLSSACLQESDTALWHQIQFPRQEPEAKKKRKKKLNIQLIRHKAVKV